MQSPADRRLRALYDFPSSSPAPHAVRPIEVLVVEAHDGMRAALRDWLLSSLPPLRPREARSMDEALRSAEQAALDLALVSVELPGPGGNGIEVARALRRRLPRCRVVVMSVNDSAALRAAALEAGATAFVPKRELPEVLGGLLRG